MNKVVIIGAGIGGLVAAVEAARAGFDVVVVEKENHVGGKIRTVMAGGAAIDAGPTVFTMKPVFDDLFERCGVNFNDVVQTEKLNTLARHFWPDGSQLDLFADPKKTLDAVAAFAGPDEARAFDRFRKEAAKLYALLNDKFIFSDRKGVFGMIAALGPMGLLELGKLGPFATLWQRLGAHFKDPRLRQLFARYATYSGGSPFLSPATLMLIADVEMQGVWAIQGGMVKLAEAVADLARGQGAQIRLGCGVKSIDTKNNRVTSVTLADGEVIPSDRVIFNGDVAALANGLLGEQARSAGIAMPLKKRSLSALTWCAQTPWLGSRLSHHNVFFDESYQPEFDAVFSKHRLPEYPTLYLCAQDRGNLHQRRERERIFMLINAPANGDEEALPDHDVRRAERSIAAHLARIGISLSDGDVAIERIGPQEFNSLFPATGGALYGQAPHGWVRSISRPEARSSIEGLYRCGGSVHPGAGVPMAALSGLRAASALIADCSSTRRSHRAAIVGGISTRSATTNNSA